MWFRSRKFWRSPIYPKLYLLNLKNVPILEQLRLEEKLLRTRKESYCLINFGSPKAVVMGISGKPDELLNFDLLAKDPLPVIKRFSGGGTVVIDESTLFITFIMAKQDLAIPHFPEPIHRWAADLYTSAWKIPGFHFRENDYCIGDRKCGGNAQYIKKDRFLHHTSFLWDYKEKNMEYLSLPPKRPAYRKDRPHTDFITRLNNGTFTIESLTGKLQEELVKRFYIQEGDVSRLEEVSHRKSVEEIVLSL